MDLEDRFDDPDGATGGAVYDRTIFIHQNGQVVLQFDGTDAEGLDANDLSHRYLWGPVVDMLLADEQIDWSDTYADGEVVWALTDHLGSVRDIVDNNATVRKHTSYDSFGDVVDEQHYDTEGDPISAAHAEAIDQLFGFTGKLLDEVTGLQNNLHRWYDSATGRWVSEDPIWDGTNKYAYVGNKSTTHVDLNGLAGVGHHYFLQAVLEYLVQQGLVTEDAYHVALGHYSGQTLPNHGYSEAHHRYNERVRGLVCEYVDRNEITPSRPISGQQMTDFINDHLVPGRDLDGKTDVIIRDFSIIIERQRAAHVRKNPKGKFPPATDVGLPDLIQRGKSFRKTIEWWKGRSAGYAFGAILGVLGESVQALDLASSSDSFRLGVEQLACGEMVKADIYFLGSQSSEPGRIGFYDELVNEGLSVSALNFMRHYQRLRERPVPPPVFAK